MSELDAIFNELVRDIWPLFKPLGYKKSGNNFRYYDQSGWGRIVQFQKSRWNSATELSFTVNVGFYLPEVDYYICPREPNDKFQECGCVVRKRISNFKGRSDEWYKLSANTDKLVVFSQIAADFSQYIMPYLATVQSRDDIYTILLEGHESDYRPAQIHAMYRAGYQESAVKLLRRELARSKSNQYYQATLKELISELTIPTEYLNPTS